MTLNDLGRRDSPYFALFSENSTDFQADYITVVVYTYNVSKILSPSCTSTRQHPSYGDCLEVKRKYYQNCSVLDCVTQCSQSAAHSYEQFLQVQQIGFVTLGPLRHAYRGGCLELYYCNMVELSWWHSSLIWKTNWFPSVLWHCWFGRMTCKNRPRNDP